MEILKECVRGGIREEFEGCKHQGLPEREERGNRVTELAMMVRNAILTGKVPEKQSIAHRMRATRKKRQAMERSWT
jgi:hypothetical protein